MQFCQQFKVIFQLMLMTKINYMYMSLLIWIQTICNVFLVWLKGFNINAFRSDHAIFNITIIFQNFKTIFISF